MGYRQIYEPGRIVISSPLHPKPPKMWCSLFFYIDGVHYSNLDVIAKCQECHWCFKGMLTLRARTFWNKEMELKGAKLKTCIYFHQGRLKPPKLSQELWQRDLIAEVSLFYKKTWADIAHRASPKDKILLLTIDPSALTYLSP